MKGLNDAKYIAGFVYTTSVLIAITFISTVTLSEYLNVYAAVYSFGFWFVNSTILSLLFVPKVCTHLPADLAILAHTISLPLDGEVLQRSRWYPSSLIQ